MGRFEKTSSNEVLDNLPLASEKVNLKFFASTRINELQLAAKFEKLALDDTPVTVRAGIAEREEQALNIEDAAVTEAVLKTGILSREVHP